MTSFAAKFPNILITGTPGTGKTQTASLASEKIGFKHINVGECNFKLIVQINNNTCYSLL